MPIRRGLLGSPTSGDEATHPEAWRRQRIEAFTALDGDRLLATYRLATLILHDRDEAEDAAQEAISRAWAGWGTLRDVDRFDAWFDRILVNVCRNRMRHKRTLHVVAFDDALELPAADNHGATAARLALGPAFQRLSPDQRIIVVLRFWRDLSIEQIAERLAIPAGTAKSRLHYALQSLRKAIESSEEADR
ncbi:MAG TPA: sigma-70 family RNA polymerase sigma factor [Candidatus Limnocylindrales bacterium]